MFNVSSKLNELQYIRELNIFTIITKDFAWKNANDPKPE